MTVCWQSEMWLNRGSRHNGTLATQHLHVAHMWISMASLLQISLMHLVLQSLAVSLRLLAD